MFFLWWGCFSLASQATRLELFVNFTVVGCCVHLSLCWSVFKHISLCGCLNFVVKIEFLCSKSWIMELGFEYEGFLGDYLPF